MKFTVNASAHPVLATLACALAITPYATHAAPAVTGVSGTVTHGELVTIAGSGFGTRSNFNNAGDTWKSGKFLNFRFKDFEDKQLTSHGFYPQRGGETWAPNSTDLSALSGGPKNSGGYMRRAYSNGENGGLSANTTGAGNQLYTTFKLMMPSNTQSGKFFRFYADSPQYNVYFSSGCDNYKVRGYSECTAGTCTPETEWGTGPSFVAGQWHRVEIWADASSNTVSVNVDGQAAWTKRDWLATTLSLNGHTLDFPNMIDNEGRGCGTAGSYNFDDIFVDFTQARVEIGDAATWSAVRKKEVQLPVTWSGGSIQVRLNGGEFSSGQNAYLYVVDSSGAVNANGYPVKLGGTALAPQPPTNVTVQ
jgi:hypothetical protein